MILKDYFWFFEKALSKDMCEQIKKFALDKREQQLGLTGGKQENSKKITKKTSIACEEKQLCPIHRLLDLLRGPCTTYILYTESNIVRRQATVGDCQRKQHQRIFRLTHHQPSIKSRGK